MVCLGNICRSPIAEGILTKYLPKSLFKVDSAGTSSFHHGEKPDLRSIEITKKNKIDISSQKSRQFNFKDFENFFALKINCIHRFVFINNFKPSIIF